MADRVEGSYAELADIAEIASAMRRVQNPDVRATMTENILSMLQERAVGSAQLCATLVAAVGNPEARAIADSVLAEIGEYGGSQSNHLGLREIDLVILAVKPPELDACLAVFGVPPDVVPVPLGATGMCGWFVDFGGQSILIAMAGVAGNVQAAIVMSALTHLVKARSAVLVGMAAGLRDQVNIGDVVVAEVVLEYEFARMMKSGPSFQPKPYAVHEPLIRNAELLPRRTGPTWSEQCRAIVRATPRPPGEAGPSPSELDGWYPEVKRGVVLAGAKLLEDGSLPKLRKEHHDRVRALEMEGAGFAAACSEVPIRWMVVRGIADYGEPDRVKGWQFASTVAAAMFVRESVRLSVLPV